ncbi:DUF2553 family protein [Alkalihalobacillus trypoxylicola]|uniref:DUF2553 domain-containing protein n=1 Tax=Alkalihalobacillus trypoxylicola TaxID=519424 RepID=A0A162ERX4_9BACI|nr:DUF2553 family protein [Alkalihalobacillus trypoxylicola]KYG33569.1 hypothetical protein AZF04_16555 [Alkalihalobacillus trypoxylicola]GAF64955.1 hypothetical protein BTS2_1851 [Bacillus sp. TS-2]
MKLEKINITSKVKGKYEEGQLNLYLGERKIGEVIENEQGLTHNMEKGFVFEADHIYHYENPNPEQIDSYIEDSWR